MKKRYDYVILGAGASGLMLAYRLVSDDFFNNKQILIIDKDQDKGNDRTWCYWEEGRGEWDALLTKTWNTIQFSSHTLEKTSTIAPLSYKMLRSQDYYKFVWGILRASNNIQFLEAQVNAFEDLGTEVLIKTNEGLLYANKLFNSAIINKDYISQSRYPLLKQHFIGWYIETSKPAFDDTVATFMDFKIPQDGNTRFMYILPVSPTEALFEYTLFSADLLEKKDYDEAIVSYLSELGINNYTIVETERGAIPMTSYPFKNLNTTNVLNIGTAGGWTKPSTGYTFSNTGKMTKKLLVFLKKKDDFKQFKHKSRFAFYDLLFIDVLFKNNEMGEALFSAMFKKIKTRTILRFLDEETNVFEDVSIMASVPSKRFVQALLRRLF